MILATIAFGWQIYFDFSGYTDMARGIAEMMGFRLMLNFNNPYTATGLGDFWNRWHISLSTWFKDYVYFPLGGNRGGVWRTYRNMFITMVVSGIWHGAAWGFVIWGALHALGRCLTRELERTQFLPEASASAGQANAGLRVRQLHLDFLSGRNLGKIEAGHRTDLHDRLGRSAVSLVDGVPHPGRVALSVGLHKRYKAIRGRGRYSDPGSPDRGRSTDPGHGHGWEIINRTSDSPHKRYQVRPGARIGEA